MLSVKYWPWYDRAFEAALTSLKAACSIRATRFSSSRSLVCQAIHSSTQVLRDASAASRAFKILQIKLFRGYLKLILLIKYSVKNTKKMVRDPITQIKNNKNILIIMNSNFLRQNFKFILVKPKFYNADNRYRKSIFTMTLFVANIRFEFIIRILQPGRGYSTFYCYCLEEN